MVPVNKRPTELQFLVVTCTPTQLIQIALTRAWLFTQMLCLTKLPLGLVVLDNISTGLSGRDL